MTLTGVGGSGKTRLALKMATDLLDEFPEGVWWVELAPLSSSASVPQAVASALGLKDAPGRSVIETLIDHLCPKHALVVLDNCEHVIEASAQLASGLLQGCPDLKVLATSREVLDVTGETSWSVPPLALPSEWSSLERLMEYDAIRLFVERAQSAQPHFTLTERNASLITETCRRLDGLPLAIELAAARLKALSVEQIFKRLDDRFQLLTGGSRTALPRHQTLRACIDWSYELLAEPERVLLRRLSVFAGGWTLQAAEFICAGEGIEGPEVLDLLAGLVDQSLVVMDPQGEEARYRLLETIRRYGLEKLHEVGEEESLRAKHLDFFLRLAEEAEPQLTGPEQKEWLEQWDMERDNLRAGLEWAMRGEPVSALRLAGALGRFWYVRGYWAEGREALEKALQGGWDGLKEWRAKALKWAGYLASQQGDYEQARGWLKESLVAYRELRDRQGIANTLRTLGGVAANQGDYATARRLYEESLAIARELTHKETMAYALGNLGAVATCQGDYSTARRFLEESLAIRKAIGYKRGLALSLEALAQLASVQGWSEQAARLLGAAEALREATGSPLPPAGRGLLDRLEATLREALGEEESAKAQAAGRAMTLEEAIELALKGS